MDATTKTEVAEAPAPEQVAALIKQEYDAIFADQRGSNHKIVERAIKVGAQLLYCKSKVAHGNWVPWVKDKCPNISKSTVERWMKLAEKKEMIEAEIKARVGKNSTATFLTLREALAIANGKGGKGNNSDTYEKAETRLLKNLEPMKFDDADTVVADTIRKLKAAVAQKKAA